MASHTAPHVDCRRYLPRRAIIPLHPQDVDHDRASRTAGDELPNLDDVQGDVIYLFPKDAEHFIFFRIEDLPSFRAALAKFQPSTSRDVSQFIHEIAERRRVLKARDPSAKLDRIPKSNSQIAFTRMGLNAMRVTGATGDTRFDNFAMRDNKTMLGDQRQWDTVFDKPNYNSDTGSVKDDVGAIHGVITIAASDQTVCSQATSVVLELFGSSISVMAIIEGKGRPGKYAKHEHFGYLDGVAQPALRGLIDPNPGQIEINPGVIVLGYKGDPVIDDPTSTITRPPWTKGGTMMVFRKLEQDVPEWNAYAIKNGKLWRQFAPWVANHPEINLTDEEGADLWGAGLVGRWPSGAPLATCPFRDDPDLAADNTRNNNFDYRVHGEVGVSSKAITDFYCPFTAHTRKTAPRDLDPLVQRQFLESGVIIRAGLPYGIEVTDEEKQSGKSSEDPDKKRGLLFVCYQSALDEGFVRQTVSYANNNYFPPTSLVPQYQGQDPILGGPPPDGSVGQVHEIEYVADASKPPPVQPQKGDEVNLAVDFGGVNVSMSGFATAVHPKSAADPPGVPQDFFVTSRGGEYFFVPPISALKAWAAGNVA